MKKYNIEKELSKMTKEKVWDDHVALDSLFSAGGESTVSDLIDNLLAYNTPDYKIVIYYDYEDNELMIQKAREETDSEFNKRKKVFEKRLIIENNKIAAKEEKERKEYERLKEKFEAKS